MLQGFSGCGGTDTGVQESLESVAPEQRLAKGDVPSATAILAFEEERLPTLIALLNPPQEQLRGSQGFITDLASLSL
jgi:hypothetical protein